MALCPYVSKYAHTDYPETTNATDPWQVVPRQIFTPYDCLLTTVAFVVVCLVGCLWVTDVMQWSLKIKSTHEISKFIPIF